MRRLHAWSNATIVGAPFDSGVLPRPSFPERLMLVRSIFAAAALLVANAPLAWADGDAAAGEGVFKKYCAVCHTTEDGKNKIGPSLHAVVGRPSGSAANFQYSEAMKGAGKTWDEAALDGYLANPRQVVPGTKMVFVGLKSDQDRKNLIAYLAAQK
jgi:cytochrome c